MEIQYLYWQMFFNNNTSFPVLLNEQLFNNTGIPVSELPNVYSTILEN